MQDTILADVSQGKHLMNFYRILSSFWLNDDDENVFDTNIKSLDKILQLVSSYTNEEVMRTDT